jgi:hypothetical protein
MKKKSTKLKEMRLFNRAILFLFVFIFASLGVYALIGTQAISVPEVSAGIAKPGVPVPTQGAYFGGINKENIPSTYQIQTTAGCTDTSDQWKLLECKIAWAGKQQGLTVPENFGMNMEHFFTSCTTGNSTFTTGGDIYRSAQNPSRKVLFINMKCSDWPTLASGTGTAYQSAESSIREKVRLMSNLAVPVIFVYNHEPENDGGEADYYRAAFRRVSYIVRDEQIKINKNRISIGWAPMGCSFEGLNLDGSLSGAPRDCPTYFPEHWYPGDDAVDWVMAQPYNKYGCTNKSNLSSCNTFDDVVDDFYNWANATCPTKNLPTGNYNCTSARKSKPLALGEYGIGSNYDEVIVSKRLEFYERNRTSAPTKYPRIKMWAYWSSQVSDRAFRYVVDWPVDTNRTNLKGFAKLALDPYFNDLKFSATKTGDLNNDNKVDVLDLSILLSNWDPTASKPKSIADINNDNKVDVLDLSALLSNWGK